MRISKFVYGFIIAFILLGVLIIAKIVGIWEVYEWGSNKDINYELISTNYFLNNIGFPSDLPTSTLVKDIKGLTGIDPAPKGLYFFTKKMII